jgi:hypothetical protein
MINNNETNQFDDAIASIVAFVLVALWLIGTVVIISSPLPDTTTSSQWLQTVIRYVLYALLLLYVTYLASQCFHHYSSRTASNQRPWDIFKIIFSQWWRYIPFLFPAQRHLRQQLEHTKKRFWFLEVNCKKCCSQYQRVPCNAQCQHSTALCKCPPSDCKCSLVRKMVTGQVC